MKLVRFCLLAATLVWCAGAADLKIPGVPNFHQVNDHVFRGGQPVNTAWPALRKLGVETVLDLRDRGSSDSAAEARAVEAAGMRYVNVPMRGLFAPTSEQMAKALALLDAGPVFVHCRRGADRTGTVVACYRMRHDCWDNQKALREAQAHGMSFVEVGMKRYILRYNSTFSSNLKVSSVSAGTATCSLPVAAAPAVPAAAPAPAPIAAPLPPPARPPISAPSPEPPPISTRFRFL